MYTHVDELLRHISNTVSIFYTSLPKPLSNPGHLTPSTVYTGRSFQTAAQEQKAYASYIGIHTIFEGHGFIYSAQKRWVNYLLWNRLKMGFGF